MYAAVPRARDGVPADVPHLVRVVRRDFDDLAVGAPDEGERAFLTEYMSDLARPYGFALRESVLAGGGGPRYQDMAEALIAATVSPDEPVDVVILAFAVPDVRAGRTAATYRGAACPGDPLAFAVCDQGTAAGFTALRLAGTLARTGGGRRSLMLVVEQAVLPYEPPEPGALPDRPVAVALLCDSSGPARLAAHRQLAGVAVDHVAAALDAELTELCAGPGNATLILGSGLTDRPIKLPTVDSVRRAPDGQPGTGVWWALADELAGSPDGTRRVVLADHDPVLGYLCLCALDIDGPFSPGQ